MASPDPAAPRVGTFPTAAAEPPREGGGLPTTLRTCERDCTMPGAVPRDLVSTSPRTGEDR